MNGLELFLLGRRLMKLGEEALPQAGFHTLPASVRSVLLDVFTHPGSSITEITERTGFPQSLVSTAVARLATHGAVLTEPDPQDGRRTLVRPATEVLSHAAQVSAAGIDGVIACALGTDDSADVAGMVASLDALARRLVPNALSCGQVPAANGPVRSTPGNGGGTS